MDLLEQHEIFELLPTHGKVVTLDADLPMKHALAALAAHGASALPVWDSALQRFVDVFSSSDLVDILLFAHRTLTSTAGGNTESALDHCHLRDLSGLKRSKPPGFLMACVDDSLAHGASMLASHGLECLPVGDGACSSSLLHLLLPEQIVLFLATLPEFSAGYAGLLEQPVGQALLPLCRPLKTVHRNTSLIDALALLSAERIDALPIVDDAGSMQDAIACRDVRQLASPSAMELGMPLHEAMRLIEGPPRVHSCKVTDTVASAIVRLASSEVSQLMCLNESDTVCAVITPSTILAALVPHQSQQ